jgi:tetratricopeptide (TPR) repeat protein
LVAESENDLALLVMADGKPEAATSDLRTALAHLRSSGGEQNALGVEIWRNLGAAYEAQSNITEAEAAYRQALAISLLRYGASHTRTSLVQDQLATVLLSSGKLREASRLLAMAQVRLQSRWGANSTQLADQQGLRALVALELDQPAEADLMLSDAVRIWRQLRVLPAHAWDLCHLAQAQDELGHRDQATASRRECLQLVQALPKAATPAMVAAIAQSALDRGDTAEAAAWLGKLPTSESSPPQVLVARARLAQATRSADAAAQVAQALARVPADAAHRQLRWGVQSLLAAQQCLAGRKPEGMALRESTLAEVRKADPERVRQLRRLATLSAACATAPSPAG